MEAVVRVVAMSGVDCGDVRYGLRYPWLPHDADTRLLIGVLFFSVMLLILAAVLWLWRCESKRWKERARRRELEIFVERCVSRRRHDRYVVSAVDEISWRRITLAEFKTYADASEFVINHQEEGIAALLKEKLLHMSMSKRKSGMLSDDQKFAAIHDILR